MHRRIVTTQEQVGVERADRFDRRPVGVDIRVGRRGRPFAAGVELRLAEDRVADQGIAVVRVDEEI